MHTDLPSDVVEELHGATIQHGPYNDRIYLMTIGSGSPADVAEAVIEKARDEDYAKVFAKIPDEATQPFLDKGFREEARVPGFYKGSDTAVFLAKYFDSGRAREEAPGDLDQVLELAFERKGDAVGMSPCVESEFNIRACTEDDLPRMAEIYQDVFPTYPFPIQDPDYLQETMETHVDYFGVETEGTLIALSSAEMDREAKNVEMTDFATLPDWRGNGLGVALLSRMEQAMERKEMATAYTIARAVSPGMNITFAKLGYEYGGRLVNNTNISGRIESMNIWHKSLETADASHT